MEFLMDFVLLAMTAITLENAIFTRALGIGKTVFTVHRGRQILVYGGMVTLLTMLSSVAGYWLTELLTAMGWSSSYRSIVYIVGMSLVYIICHFALSLLPKRISSRANGYLSLAAFNCAVLGSVMLSAMQSYTFPQYLGFGFGTGVGFTIAYWLVVEGRRRTELSALPRSFRGFPAMVLYIGIMSLAFYGLSGHQLPL